MSAHRSAGHYDDESLAGIADNICTLGNIEDGVRILDNYRYLEAEEFAEIALRTACE